MFGAFFSRPSFLPSFILLLGLFGCSASQPPAKPAPAMPVISSSPKPAVAPTSSAATQAANRITVQPGTPVAAPFPVMLGIDVLEAEGFASVKGKRIGLLTHPAGVNRRGETTVSVLRRAPGVKLVALYGPEHGIYGDAPAEIKVANTTDTRTGLPVYSLYGATRKPTKTMLKGLDAMVIDLQDIGSRSYTYISAMLYTMAACFENNVEVIVLDRPNPLGGLKVDGPLLDAKWKSYVGAFRVPYVHGLTIGELARMAKEAPGVMSVPNAIEVSDAVRERGKLTVIPMRGWRRSMRWPETGLTWVATSPYIQDFSAVIGYAMTGLGTYFDPSPKVKFDIGFRHGVGTQYPFMGISHSTIKSEIVEKELNMLNVSGLQYRRVSAPDRNGKPATGIYIIIADYDDWRPTELSFNLMRLATKLSPKNPFLTGDASGFLRHMGSEEFYNALRRDGARVDLPAFLAKWQAQDRIYQQQSKRFWLYN